MSYHYLVFLVIIGLSIGSFINAAVYRLKHKRRGLIFGRSFCPSCKKTLSATDLIPLLSYLFLRAKCRFCRKKIAAHYFWIELISGMAFLGAGLMTGFSNPLLLAYQLVFISVLIFIASYDFQFGEIPDEVSLPAIFLALAGSFLSFTESFWSSLFGLLLGAGIFFALVFFSRGKWMGGGDIRLAALLGALLGWQGFLLALLFASLFGSLVGVLQILLSGKSLRSAVPFGPYLALGAYVVLFFGEYIWTWYLSFLFIS